MVMGLFDGKSSIIGAALGVSGAFDKSRKTDKAAAFGAALGASIGSGQKWTMADSLRLGAAISALDAGKEDSTTVMRIVAVLIIVMIAKLRKAVTITVAISDPIMNTMI